MFGSADQPTEIAPEGDDGPTGHSGESPSPVARVRSLVAKVRAGELAAESGWGMAIEITTLIGTVLSFTLLGRSLGAAGYGGYASLYAIVGPLVTLAASGVVLAILQHIVRDLEPLPSTARSCLSLSLILGFLLTGAGWLIASWIVETLDSVAIVSILLTEFVAAPLIQVAASTVQAGTSFTEAAKIRLRFLIARIVVIVALFATDSLTVANLGMAMFVVAMLIGIHALGQVGRRYDFRFVPGVVRARHLKTNVLYSTAISASALNSDGDKLVLAANRLVVDTGLYSAAYRIVSFGLLPIGGLVQATHAQFLEHEEGVRGQHLRRSIRFGSIGGVYGVFAGIALFIAAPLLPLLMGDEFADSVVMVRWLSPVLCLRALGIFALNGLMGLDRVALRTVLIVVNAAASLALYIVLIPIMGWEGAAVGTLISEALVAGSGWIALMVCQRRDDRLLDDAEADDGPTGVARAADVVSGDGT